MKKSYVIFPVIGLLIFGAVYWNFVSEFEAREKAKELEKRQQIEAKARADFETRRKAIEEANALQEQRKKEKAEREAREAREKKAQLELADARDEARDDRDRILRQVDRLRGELKLEREAVEKIVKDRENAIGEEAFLQKYIKAAEANQKSLQELLVKIDKADKDAAAAAAQAANQKKRS